MSPASTRYDIPLACDTTRASSTCSPTGTSAAAATASGTRGRRHRRRGGFDTLYTVLEVRDPRGRPAACRSSPRRSGAGSPAARCTWRTGRTPAPARRSTPSSRRWTASARSARSDSRCARLAGCGCACPGALTVVTAHADALRPFSAIVADEVNVKTVEHPRRRQAHESDFGVSADASRSTPGRPARAWARRCRPRSRAASPATGR
jgi:isoleucyl-tRNA synthetase